MFKIGDKLVYPMHGAGVVENIEDKLILGEIRSYYIIEVLHGRMRVMVPVSGSEQVGLRAITDHAGIRLMMDTLAAESTPMDDNWNRRNRDNMDKLRTGKVDQVAEVVRNLMRVDRIKKLSTGEKKLLNNARQILVGEIALVENVTEEEAAVMIDKAVG